jgi:hypothetical protein
MRDADSIHARRVTRVRVWCRGYGLGRGAVSSWGGFAMGEGRGIVCIYVVGISPAIISTIEPEPHPNPNPISIFGYQSNRFNINHILPATTTLRRLHLNIMSSPATQYVYIPNLVGRQMLRIPLEADECHLTASAAQPSKVKHTSARDSSPSPSVSSVSESE